MEAFRVDLPTTWDVNGSVQWYGRQRCALDQIKYHFMATAKDGKEWIELIPGGVWQWSPIYNQSPKWRMKPPAGTVQLGDDKTIAYPHN